MTALTAPADTGIAPGPTPVLEVTDLVVTYPLAVGGFAAVDHVSLAVRPGEAFGLVGESGSGKTTLAMAILQLLKPPARVEGGSVRLGDVDLTRVRGSELRQLRWSRMSLVPQGAMNSLNPVMRVRDQVGDAIRAHERRPSSREVSERVIGLLATVGLPGRVAGMYPHELSGGMKQRVCIAMAIALDPDLVIADEPTSALDVVVQRVVAQTLLDVRARINASLILIGHDMGLQAQMVDRLAVMYRGRLVEVGTVHDIFKAPVHPYTQLLIGSVPSIRAPRRAVQEQLARQATMKRIEGDCPLGPSCPWRDEPHPPPGRMHEVGTDHLVGCRSLAEAMA